MRQVNIWTIKQRRDAIEMYKSGWNSREVSRMTGIPPSTIRTWLENDGVPRHPKPQLGRQRRPDTEIDSIVTLYKSGMTQREIADLMGRHQTAISKVVREAGVSRPKSEQCKLGHQTRRKKVAV